MTPLSRWQECLALMGGDPEVAGRYCRVWGKVHDAVTLLGLTLQDTLRALARYRRVSRFWHLNDWVLYTFFVPE
jgi:hypothetical protein